MDQLITGRDARYDLNDLGLLDSSPEREFDIITRMAMHGLHCDQGLFLVRDVASASFFVRAKEARDLARPIPTSVCSENSPCEKVIDTGAVLAVDDMTKSPDYHEIESAEMFSIMSFLGAPVRGVLGEPVGVLAVTCSVPRSWSDMDLQMIEEFAFLLQRNILLRAALETVKRLSRERDLLLRGGSTRH